MSEARVNKGRQSLFFLNVIGIVVIFIVLKELQGIFIPLVLAYFFFFLFEPLNKILGRIKIPSSLFVIIDLLIIVLFLGGISSIIIDSFSQFGQQLPVYEQKLNSIVSSSAASLNLKDPKLLDFKIAEVLKEIDVSILASNLFSSTFSFLGTLFFVIFFFIFVVTGHQKIYESIRKRYVTKYIQTGLNNNARNEIDVNEMEKEGDVQLKTTFNEIINGVQKYILTKFIMSFIMALTVAVILLLFGVDFPVVFAVITFLFHFVPNIGSIIAVLLPSVMALLQFESVGYALFLVVVLIVVQNIIGNIIEPRVFGETVGLNPLVVLLSLLLWGYIWGIVGMILSVPLTAIIKIVISRSESPNLKFLNDLMSS